MNRRALTGLVVLVLVLCGCHHVETLSDDPPIYSCVIKTSRPVEMITQDENGRLHPASFDVAIHSDDPVEPQDFLGPVDFELAPIKYKISHDFTTKFMFESAGVHEVTAIMVNPYTRGQIRCAGKFDVREYNLEVNANPGRIPLGQDVMIQAKLGMAQGKVTYTAKASDGSVVRIDPETGSGMVNFHSEGKKWITVYATDTLDDGVSHRTYKVSAKQFVEVENSNSLACRAQISASGSTADPSRGDLMEATIVPVGDPTAEIDVVSFDPGVGSYDIQIDQNVVHWRYSHSGEFLVTGVCRNRADGKVGRIVGPTDRIVAADPLSAKARANFDRAYTEQEIIISARANGGLGKSRITGIQAPDTAGLKIVRSNRPNRWVVKFANPSMEKPYQLNVEMRDENGAAGACVPPHCTQTSLDIQVKDPVPAGS